MIHMMEEDSPSSISHPFRSRRQVPMNPGKRARSPEGSSPADRPSVCVTYIHFCSLRCLIYIQKRLTLAIGGITRRPDYRHLSLGSASSSLGTSADWVQQAGGLSIDSPFHSDHENPFVGSGDVDMVGVDFFDKESLKKEFLDGFGREQWTLTTTTSPDASSRNVFGR